MRIGVIFHGPDAKTPRQSRAALDSAFLDKATQRLGVVSAVFASAVAALLVFSLLFSPLLGGHASRHLPHFLAAQTTLLCMSIAMAFVIRRRLFQPCTIQRLGLVYQIGGALLISVCAFASEMLLQSVMVKLSWLAVWILLFPLFIPARPLRSLVVSSACASMAPLVFLTWIGLSGRSLPPGQLLVATFLPYYICAGLAVVPAWLVYDLGTAVSAAKDEIRHLGSYRLVERLGSGGMGEVWRAEHELLARPAAVKLIRPNALGAGGESQVSDEVLARFAREAQTTAVLRSPHTVSLYDYGITEDDTFYYAMEFLEGLDLETLVNRFGPLSPARTVHMLRQACESLEEAHAAGLVHRDIKPANLVACKLGTRYDFLKVLDFGLVTRSRGQPRREDVLETDSNFILGTPAFMPPEQAIGESAVDPRSDIYALGCVGYWLLTGRLVFEHTSAAMAIADHVHATPQLPSEKAEQQIPPELEAVIMECLRKDPALRPQSAEDLQRRLERLEVPPWTQDQARLWWRARQPFLTEELRDAESSRFPTWSSVGFHMLPDQAARLAADETVNIPATEPSDAPAGEVASAPTVEASTTTTCLGKHGKKGPCCNRSSDAGSPPAVSPVAQL